MSEEMMFSWRVKLTLATIFLVVFFILDRWVANYATIVQEGSVQRVIAIGEVLDVNTGDILYMGDRTVRIGRITDSDMYGNITFLDRSGKTLNLKRGRGPKEVVRTAEGQDQILTMRIATWPRQLRKKGQDFRNRKVVVGNTFSGRFLDRVIRVGDRTFLEIPMTRPDRIDRVELREFFRNTYLIRLAALLCIALALVGGIKGLMSIGATLASLLVILAVFVPGLLGRVEIAARHAAILFGLVVLAGAITWYARALFSPARRGRLRETLRNQRWSVPVWLLAVPLSAVGTWWLILVIGHRPIWLALFVAFAITLITFVIVGGYSPKVISGSLGTVGGLIAAALISYLASRLLWFTGLSDYLGYLELGTALWRDATTNSWPFRDFLTAGLIIAALGAMMDVSMSISSTIYEVKRANPDISVRDVIRSGYQVGKDIMSTMTDTLIFAFIGADLVMIVRPGLTYGEAGRLFPFLRILNGEAAAIEVVQALMGTLGLVLAIPISALIAGLLTARFTPTRVHAAEEGKDGC